MGVAPPAILDLVLLEETLQIIPCPRRVTHLETRVPGVAECHVVIGPEFHDEFHERTGANVITRIGCGVPDLEDDHRTLPLIFGRQREQSGASIIRPAGRPTSARHAVSCIVPSAPSGAGDHARRVSTSTGFQ